MFFDLSSSDIINNSLLAEAKRESGPNRNLIYLLGNKLDISKEYLEEHRKKAKILIDSGVIDKYFEVSAKTREGIDHFFKILRIDAANYCQFSKGNKKRLFNQMEKNSIDLFFTKFGILNKYIKY